MNVTMTRLGVGAFPGAAFVAAALVSFLPGRVIFNVTGLAEVIGAGG
jgi:hypothetical protein